MAKLGEVVDKTVRKMNIRTLLKAARGQKEPLLVCGSSDKWMTRSRRSDACTEMKRQASAGISIWNRPWARGDWQKSGTGGSDVAPMKNAAKTIKAVQDPECDAFLANEKCGRTNIC